MAALRTSNDNLDARALQGPGEMPLCDLAARLPRHRQVHRQLRDGLALLAHSNPLGLLNNLSERFPLTVIVFVITCNVKWFTAYS